MTRMLLLICGICVLSTGAMSADNGVADIDSARAALEKWVETRRIISQEKRDWELGREMLTERIELVQREIDSLRGKISDAEQSITEADRKRVDLVDENDRLKEASAELNGTIIRLEARIGELLWRLPDPIREHVKPLSQRLPTSPEETKLSLSERFQNVIGILNEIDKFNREITLTSEVRTLPDGSSTEVTAVYVGIGQAYYVSANGKVAGIGKTSSQGWTWTPADHLAPQIAEAIAILKNEQVASFVKLPVEIE